jgi:hypothetical protein
VVVLHQHDREGIAVGAVAVRLERGKEMTLFLGGVILVGEVAKELDRLPGRFLLDLPGRSESDRHYVKASEYLLDDPVLLHENVRRLHGLGLPEESLG